MTEGDLGLDTCEADAKPYKGPPALGINWSLDSPGKEKILSSMTFNSVQPPNPKTLMGNLKIPIFSVIPMTALIREAEAMRYGAYEAPRLDGTFGYGPFNWRESKIEFMTYLDAAARHIACVADREDIDPTSMATHLGHARGTLGILIDAIEHGTVIDDRSKTACGKVAALLRILVRSK